MKTMTTEETRKVGQDFLAARDAGDGERVAALLGEDAEIVGPLKPDTRVPSRPRVRRRSGADLCRYRL